MAEHFSTFLFEMGRGKRLHTFENEKEFIQIHVFTLYMGLCV